MLKYTIRNTDPNRDFERIASWFSILENEESSQQSLQEYYEKRITDVFSKVVVSDTQELLGFF